MIEFLRHHVVKVSQCQSFSRYIVVTVFLFGYGCVQTTRPQPVAARPKAAIISTERIGTLAIRVESTPTGATVFPKAMDAKGNYAASPPLGTTPFDLEVGRLEKQLRSDGSAGCIATLGGSFTWSVGSAWFSGGTKTLDWPMCPPEPYLTLKPSFGVHLHLEAAGTQPVDRSVEFHHLLTPKQTIRVDLPTSSTGGP